MNLKPEEISSVIKEQIKRYASQLESSRCGNVIQVADGIARIHGLENAMQGELLRVPWRGLRNGNEPSKEDNVGAVLLGPTDQVKEGDTVKRTRRIASINVSENMIGRVIDPLGNPIDGKGEIVGKKCQMPLERKAPGVISANR